MFKRSVNYSNRFMPNYIVLCILIVFFRHRIKAGFTHFTLDPHSQRFGKLLISLARDPTLNLQGKSKI